MLERASCIIDPSDYPIMGFILRLRNESNEFPLCALDRVVCFGYLYLMVFVFSICIVKCVMDKETTEDFQERIDEHDGSGLTTLNPYLKIYSVLKQKMKNNIQCGRKG